MSKTKNKSKNENENKEHEVYAVSYTKAGLASKNSESGSDGENETAGREESDSTENTPKISKEKSTERDHERPIH